LLRRQIEAVHLVSIILPKAALKSPQSKRFASAQ